MRITKIYKDLSGAWLGDVSGPITEYPAYEVVVEDDSEIPVPPEPIPPPVLTAVDNSDPKMVYAGSWYSGPTTAPGFYGNTIAYSQTVGNTLTLHFTGTSIEVFCEKKVGHGSGTFQVDQQTPQTVNLGVAGPVGSTSVFKAEGLTNAQHVLKITVAGGGNVVFDYVKINGEATTAPIPPIPPTTDTIIQPGQSIKAAVEGAAAGKVFRLLAGLYSENIVNVPVGVSIRGAGKNQTTIEFVGSHPQNSETAVFQCKSSSQVNGNQILSGFTVRGKNLANGGIMTDKRDNVILEDVFARECNFFGVWTKNTTAPVFRYSELYNCSWCTTGPGGWASGELCLFNTLEMDIHHNFIHTDRVDKGYAIKALWPDNPPASNTISGNIYDNDFDMSPTSNWNNGQSPNISIELAACLYAGIDIYKNKIRNVLSMAAHRPTKSGRLIIRENDMTQMKGNTTCAIELVCSNVTIIKNNIKGSAMFTGNFQPNGKWTDQIIEDNDYVSNGSNPGYGGTFLIGPDGANMTITNNRLKYLPYTMVKHMGNPANSTIVDTGNTKT
jgi:hypothetical protein